LNLANRALDAAHFSTESIAQASRFDSWRSAVAGLYDVPSAGDVEDFRGRASSLHLGDVVLGEMEATVATYERSLRRIRRDGLDHLVFGASGAGDAARVTVLDMSQPIQLPRTALDGFCLIAPRHLAARRLGDPSRLHGACITGAAAGLTTGFLAQVMSTAPRLSISQSRQLAGAAMELLAATIGVAPVSGGPSPRPSRRANAREYIEAKLSDPALSANLVARETGMSRSVLYGLFKDDGGVVKYIQSRRLAWASRLLAEDRELRIAEISELCCFSSETQFSRAFRGSFGETPRDRRRTAGWPGESPLSSDHQEDGATFSRWVRDLAVVGRVRSPP